VYYNFDTENEHEAAAALLVYVIYRSRDKKRFKVRSEIWQQIERAVKSTAKRSETLQDFIEKLKPKLMCGSIQPRWAQTIPEDVISMKMNPETGELIQIKDKGQRKFLTDVLREVDHKKVLEILYKNASFVVLLVRDRLEREKPIEVETEKEVVFDGDF